MVERLFLAVPQDCLRFVIVVFPDHTHLLFLEKWDLYFMIKSSPHEPEIKLKRSRGVICTI